MDPRSKGFAYCMVDYYFNIRARSASGAPFNLWPFSFKFGLLQGELIYWAQIHDDDSIETMIFPDLLGEEIPITLDPLPTYARSRALTTAALMGVAAEYGLVVGQDRASLIADLQGLRDSGDVNERELSDRLATHVYLPLVESRESFLPEPLR